MDIRAVSQIVLDWLQSSGLRVLLILVVMFLVLRLLRLIAMKMFRRSADRKDDEVKKRIETLRTITGHTLNIVITLVVVMMVMSELGVKIGPLLAAAGVFGLAVSFGAQHLVQDVISGFFLLMEEQIRVGDVVQISGKSGLVEKINLRMTVIRDLAGNVHYVRNGQIDVVTNMTKDYSRYVFDIGVAYKEDIDEVIQIIEQVDEEMRADPLYKDDILEPIEILGLDQFAESAIVIKARIKTKPIRQWAVGRAFNGLLKKRFNQRNIEIPFPHVTLYIGEDKQGAAAPLNVNMTKGGS